MNRLFRLVPALAISLFFSVIFCSVGVYATSADCIDISGQTTKLSPPNSDLIDFDPSGGQPPTAMEACISNLTTSRFAHDSGVTTYPLKGYAWNENAGWVQFDWVYGTSNSQTGVDEDGYLYGYAWNDNIGWIKFDWWNDALYPSKKLTAGVPRIDYSTSAPFTITGYAWNDRLGWFNMHGAKTNWQPPRCILAESDCLPVPERNICKETYLLPYIHHETDLASLATVSIQVINRPHNMCKPTISWSSTDAGAKFNGLLQIYTATTKSVQYKPSNATQAIISINLTNGTDTHQQDLQLKPVFQHKCGGVDVNYLPECNPPNTNYCDASCMIKDDPTLKFCGNRKVEVDKGEECDAGFYGGYLDATRYCNSSCKIEIKPTVKKEIQLKTPFDKIEDIPPANPATHSYGTCFCLEDVDGNCVQVDGSVITNINVKIDYDNTMLFDQSLSNTAAVKDSAATHIGNFGEAAPVFIYESNNVVNKANPTVDGSEGKYTINLDLQSGSNGLACLDVRSYTPTSGANAYDENHNGVIDLGDYFYDGDSDVYRIKMNNIRYEMTKFGQKYNFEYDFDEYDGFFHFRPPVEVTKLDTKDGKNFIHAIVEAANPFLTYVTRVVPDGDSISNVPENDQINVTMGIDRAEDTIITSPYYFDIDTLTKRLVNSGKDDSIIYNLDLWLGAAGEIDTSNIYCNLGDFCDLYVSPYYKDEASKALQTEPGTNVQVFTEVSYAAKDFNGDSIGKTVKFLSNQFPRGRESAVANPLADIKGTISSSSGVYTRREGQVVITVGDLSTNTVRNAITANVSDLIRGVESKITATSNMLFLGYLLPEAAANSSSTYAKLMDSKVIYTKSPLRIRETTSLPNNTTVIVDGANVYIDGNINPAENRFGIIALEKCVNGNLSQCSGGNIYIAPNVTNIHANIYADGSVFSYDENANNVDSNGVPKLSSTERINLLSQAQLVIKGSISSQNTVGGSVGSGGKYVLGDGTFTSNQSEAIPYDLNHLRYVKLKRGTSTCAGESGNFVPDIVSRADGLGACDNEAIYVFYVAPPSGLPGFQVSGNSGTSGQVR